MVAAKDKSICIETLSIKDTEYKGKNVPNTVL